MAVAPLRWYPATVRHVLLRPSWLFPQGRDPSLRDVQRIGRAPGTPLADGAAGGYPRAMGAFRVCERTLHWSGE